MAELALLNRLAVAIALKCRKSSVKTKQQHKATALCILKTQVKLALIQTVKGIRAMLKYVREHKNEIAYVVVWKLDRLSRCLEDFFAEILKPIKKYG